MTQSSVARSAQSLRAVPPVPTRLAAIARRLTRGALLVGLLALNGCLYGFSSGSGLPKNLRSVAVQPFDNQTAVPELQREVFEQLRKSLRDRLNLREAPESKADVIVRGIITRYEVDLPAGVSADPRQTTSTRRRLQIVMDVETLDQTTGRSLVKRAGISKEGQYAEGGETTGRKNAIESLVNELLDGAQSQW